MMNTSTLQLWRDRNFLLIWSSKVISGFGFQFYLVALPLLIYQLSQSALAMSTMRAIEFVPNILLGMVAGVIVDRFSRRKVMIATTLIMIICLVIIITLLGVDQIQLWHLFLLGFVLSSSGFTFGNAQHSIIPQLFPKEQLVSVNARFTFVDTLINLIGPGIAGLLLAVASFQTNFIINAVSSSIVLILLFLLVLPADKEKKKSEQTSIWTEMKEGIAELFSNRLLLVPTLVILIMNLASSLTIGVTMFFAVDLLGASEKEVGFMLSMGAIGGLVGSALISRMRKKWTRGQIFISSILVHALGIGILVFASTWWMIGISTMVRSFAVIMTNIVYLSFRQEFTPNHLLGRVAGTSSMMMKLVTPLGLFLSGLWAETYSIQVLFIISTVLILAIYCFIYRHPIKMVE